MCGFSGSGVREFQHGGRRSLGMSGTSIVCPIRTVPKRSANVGHRSSDYMSTCDMDTRSRAVPPEAAPMRGPRPPTTTSAPRAPQSSPKRNSVQRHQPPTRSITESAMVGMPLSGTIVGRKPRFPPKCAWDAGWGRVPSTHQRRAVAIVAVPVINRMSLVTTINWWCFPRTTRRA